MIRTHHRVWSPTETSQDVEMLLAVVAHLDYADDNALSCTCASRLAEIRLCTGNLVWR